MTQEALKLALGQLQAGFPGNAMQILREALAQQELVVLQYPQIDIDWQREQQIKAQASTPTQRTWVGLTDAEITELRLKTLDAVATNHEVYRAIEAKLKEKNT